MIITLDKALAQHGYYTIPSKLTSTHPVYDDHDSIIFQGTEAQILKWLNGPSHVSYRLYKRAGCTIAQILPAQDQ